MLPFSLEEAFILSIWVELLLYGCLVPLFWASMYILVRKAAQGAPNKPMIVAAVLMFVLATAHVGVNLRRLLQGFIWGKDPVTYFNDLDAITHVLKDTMYTTQSLLGDAFAIYRCYVVWDRKRRIVAFPLVLLICSAFSGYIVAWLFTRDKTADSVFATSLRGWIISFYTLALAQNIITTSLISYAIWSRDRHISAFREGGRSLMPIVGIVVESAAVYVLAQVVLIILYALDCNAQYIVLESITPIVGLVFMTIIVRVGLRSHPMHTVPVFNFSKSESAMQPINVKVHTVRVTDGESEPVTPITPSDSDAARLQIMDPVELMEMGEDHKGMAGHFAHIR